MGRIKKIRWKSNRNKTKSSNKEKKQNNSKKATINKPLKWTNNSQTKKTHLKIKPSQETNQNSSHYQRKGLQHMDYKETNKINC